MELPLRSPQGNELNIGNWTNMETQYRPMSGMKRKTIKGVIKKKVNAWLATIEDQNVRDLAAKNTIVTGGSIASMLLGEPVNDFDIYFRNYNTALAVAKYYVARFKPKQHNGIECRIYVANESKQEINGEEKTPDDRVQVIIKSAGIASELGTKVDYSYFEASQGEGEIAGEYIQDIMEPTDTKTGTTEEISQDTDYRPVFMSSNAITLSGKMQLILRFHGEPEVIHEYFDFVHCTNYWTSWDGELTLLPKALEALMARELRYVGSKYPLCSLIRLRKFIKRGYTINAGQILKMAMQISKLNFTDIKVLEDQTTGVDQAYFREIINILEAGVAAGKPIDNAYIIEIIDRMF